MLEVTFCANSRLELEMMLRDFLGMDTIPVPTPPENIPASDVTETSPPKKKKVKEEKTSSEPTPSLSQEDVVKALSDLNAKAGIVVARSVLQKFGCARISELKEEQRNEFVTACIEAGA